LGHFVNWQAMALRQSFSLRTTTGLVTTTSPLSNAVKNRSVSYLQKNSTLISLPLSSSSCNLSTTSSRNASSSPNYAQSEKRKLYQIRNKALHSVKETGLPILESITQDVISNAKLSLFPTASELAPSVSQIKVASRMYTLLNEELENYCERTPDEQNVFTVGGEPIVIIDVEVSPDLRYARVFWALPFDLLLDLPSEKFRSEMMKSIQRVIQERGGVLQGLVHGKLRRFHPPRIRWVPASNELIRGVLKEMEYLE